jgi:hypothetical protein
MLDNQQLLPKKNAHVGQPHLLRGTMVLRIATTTMVPRTHKGTDCVSTSAHVGHRRSKSMYCHLPWPTALANQQQ